MPPWRTSTRFALATLIPPFWTFTTSALTSLDPGAAAAGRTTTPSLTGIGAMGGAGVSLGPRFAGGVAVRLEGPAGPAAAAGAGRAAGLAAGGTRFTAATAGLAVAPAGLAAVVLGVGFDAPIAAGGTTAVVRARVTFGFAVGGAVSAVWSSLVGRSVIRLAYLPDAVMARSVIQPSGRTSAILRGATTSVPSAEPWYPGHQRRA
jgi:hypothetical protein